MKKLLLSIGSLLFVSAALAGTTGAFLADSGTSTGNTFASGVIELKVDNESYVTNNDGKLVVSTSTSWALSKLAGHLFFNFSDVKPGDIGEDTISLHVNNNNAYACMNVNLTGTPENGQNEPEAAADPTAGTNDGELQNYLYFVFWADDGDNVYEQGEHIFKQGLVKDIFNGQNWSLADATTNIWGTPGPIKGDTVAYIGKAWCFGTLTAAPVPQDGHGKTGSNGPLARGTGFTCNGAPVGNIVQSDGITADVSFSVVQSRDNGSFTCQGGDQGHPPTSTSTLFSENFNDCSKHSDDDDHHSHDGYDKNNSYGSDHSGYHDFSWSDSWSCKGTSDKDDDYSHRQCSKNAVLDAGGSAHSQQLVTPAINTVGYHTITLMYDRSTSGGSHTKLVVEFSVDGGTSWTTLETVTGNSSLATKTFSLSPSADNTSSVKVRFTLTGTSSSNAAVIDNVVVTGVSP